MADSFGLKIGLEGEKEFKKALGEINSSFKVLGSEMKLVSSQFDKNDQSVQALSARNTVLNKEIEVQKQKIETLRAALENAAASFGENDRRTQNWQIQLNNAQAALNDMERELEQNNDALDKAADEFDDAEKQADDFGDEVEDAGKQSEDAGGKFEKLGSICKAVGVAIAASFAAVSAAAVAAGKALVDMAVEGAAYADTVLTESVVTGIATDKLQEYMYAAELVDVSTEALTNSMAKQIKSMKSVQDGSKTMSAAYEALGISVTDSNGHLRDSDTVYWELIDSLGKVENETERDALAMQVLGKSAQELNPLIEAGADRMKELGQQAQAAGYVLSDEMLAAYGALDDNLQTLKVNVQGAKNALGTVLLPVLAELSGTGVELLAEFTKGIQEANGDVGKMSDVISEVLPKALDAVMEYAPELLEVIGSIIGAIGGAVIDNLPIIVEAVSQIILTILDGLISSLPQITDGALQLVLALVSGILANLPMLMETAAQVIATLVSGIAQAIPTLIPTLVQVVMQMCQTLVDNLPLILEAALQLIAGLAQGLLDAIPVLVAALPEIIVTIVEAIPKIIDSIITAVLGAIPQIIQAGIQLLISLVRALPQIITTIVQAIPEIISGIVNALIGNIDKIILAGVELFVALIENLPTIIVEIVKAVPQIIAGIVSAFGSQMYKIVEIGGNIVKGLWEGIQSLSSWLWNKVYGWISSIWDGICNFFGIHSPSDEMAWVGEMLVKGLAGSIDRNGDEAVKAAEGMAEDINSVMNGLVKDVSPSLTTDFSAHSSGSAGVKSPGGYGGSQTVINIYPQSLDQATIDYLFLKFNARLGAAI